MAANKPFIVWRFVDGKPGHEKQSHALVEGLKKQGLDIKVVDYRVRFSLVYYLWQYLIRAVIGPDKDETPQLIVGAGHKTHWPMLFAKRQSGAKVVVILSPSLPVACFDCIIAPEHDYHNKLRRPENLFTVPFALVEPLEGQPNLKQGLVLLGGESKPFYWDSEKVAAQIKTIIDLSPSDINWSISTSRRTPAGMLEQIRQACDLPSRVSLLDYADLADSWLPEQLIASGHIWVSADSASMIAEALATKAQVGIISLSSVGKTNKIQCAIDTLINKKQVFCAKDLPLPVHAGRPKSDDVINKLVKYLEIIP